MCVCTVLFLPPEWLLSSFALSSFFFFSFSFSINIDKKRDSFFLSLAPLFFCLMNSELVGDVYASARLIILITDSTNEERKKKRSYTLRMALASSLPLFSFSFFFFLTTEGKRREENCPFARPNRTRDKQQRHANGRYSQIHLTPRQKSFQDDEEKKKER